VITLLTLKLIKKFPLLSFFLLIECQFLSAQTIFLQEDFSTVSGTTPPTGWTVQTAIGDPLVDLWHFDNPGRRTPNTPIAGKFACFDSDKLSNNNQAEEVYLISPVFNATTTDNIIMEFDQYFMGGFGATCTVEIFNGTSWLSVYTNNTTTTNPLHTTFDITSVVQNKINAQVRFKWTGNYSWFWIIDNIKITIQPVIAEQFTEQTSIILTGVTGDVAWGDCDNDDDLDILSITKIYSNNGYNSFTGQTGITLTGVSYGSVAWGDYDNDSDLDILLTGYLNSDRISKIYRNNGDNTFTEQTDIVLTGVDNSSVAWGDYDNDGNLDILLTGSGGSSYYNSKIYHNNGDNSFTEQTSIALTGVYDGSIAWGDYDNDGNLDILLTGSTGTSNISKIFRNNGNNSFTEQTGIALTGVYGGSVAWGDYDNDGNLDILLTGYLNSGCISKIYHNNGDNSFAEQTGIVLTGVYRSSVAWGDYDNDGDLDILLTGYNYSSSQRISKIYRNNGDNSFTEQTGIMLTGVTESSVAWGDYDNDGDLDILLSGNSVSASISKIYKNNNTLKNTPPTVPSNLNAVVNYQQIQFTWDKSTDVQTPQAGLSYNLVISSTTNACDIVSPMSNTANGFRKVVQIGNRSKTNFYTLNSSLPAGTYYWGVQAIDNAYAGSAFATGTFTITDAQATYLRFTDITIGSIKISWTRGNKQKCVVFIRQTNTGLPTLSNNITYYANSVYGKGTQAGDGWYCVYNGTGENVNVTGLSGSFTYKIMVIEYSGEIGQETYLTFSNGTNPKTCSTKEQFTEQTGITLAGVDRGSIAWGDYDNDGYLDILLTGNYNLLQPISKIYRNNGDNSFTEQTGIALTGVHDGSAAWGDYDNDGDQDILLTGATGNTAYNPISKIYRNNGDNSFTEQTGIVLAGVYGGSGAWGDFDNDGDLDILLTGNNNSYQAISTIYRNNSNNSFTEQSGINLTGISGKKVVWGDYDNDGDLDILLTGSGNIYRNNGDNSFTEQTGINLTGVSGSKVAWGDYDNDGDLDILLTGTTGMSPNLNRITKIYRNNGDNSFTEQTGIILLGENGSSVAWGDYDNDGDLDIVITGYSSSGSISKIYRNNGDNSFTEQPIITFIGVFYSSGVSWGDYDSDGDLDILLTGMDKNSYCFSRIYKNNCPIKNTPPGTPSSISAYLTNNKLVLTWNKATDNETSQLGLTYNLRIGTTPGGCEILSPMSLPNGKLTIATFGNVEYNTKWTIDLSRYSPLPENIYYSVQAIDNGFMGSDWSPEKSEISNFIADFLPNTACQNSEVQFQDKSYSIEYPITTYLWKFTEGSIITTSSVQNPIHTFQTVGTHQVELTITNSNNKTANRTKSVTALPSPLSDFTALPVCQGASTTITNTTNNNGLNITSWRWDFGDGQTSPIQQPTPHGYLNAGDYPVKLKAVADNGCVDSTIKTITVGSYPVAAITTNASLTFCKGDSIVLSVEYNSSYSYKWLISGTGITDADSSRYTAKSSGNYSIEVINLKGNCKTTSSGVTVTATNAPYKPVIESTNYQQGKCPGEDQVKLSANQAVAGYHYLWYKDGLPLLNDTLSYLYLFEKGNYKLEADMSSCKVESEVFNIDFSDSPAKPFIYVQGPIVWYLACSNDSASKYRWYCNDELIEGADKYFYVANRRMGNYQVSIGNDKECYTRSDVVTIPTGATGINDIDPFEGLKIYPNPTPGMVKIEMDNNLFGELLIKIITVQGKDILSIKFEKTNEHFSGQIILSGQSKGVYLINLLIDKYMATRKVTLE
jgi:PKD repeat protein